ncbi:4-hydroxy-tetrahydrodipicolinate synthase [Nemorincola caseinilytica]|uniref:4-hydroxy-tetrahydrodipicolinate synthase n=1 Tax=Nemorincola caseinilytica TaxID=2054315 RepID=A0ABP8NP36_9BACT
MAYQQFKGTGVALVTPFLKDGSVDHPALEKLTAHVIKGGVDFVVALGTTAETPTLSAQEKADVLATVLRANDGHVPVVCGIGGNNTTETVQQLKDMDLRDVDAILSVAPYYNRPSQEGIYQHFKAIASNTNKPIILYNVPARTGSNIMPATAIRLAGEYNNIIAIKEASGNIAQCLELIHGKPDNFTVLSGDDNLALAQMAIGMEGIISVAANCFTKDMTDVINLAIVGKFDKARKVFYKMLPGIDMLFAEGNPTGVKCMLKHMGICEQYVRLPLVQASDALSKKMAQYLNGN